MPLLIKERSTLFCILPSLHAAEFRGLLVKNNWLDTALREHLQDFATPFTDQRIGEKIAVAYNNAKRNRSIFGHKFNSVREPLLNRHSPIIAQRLRLRCLGWCEILRSHSQCVRSQLQSVGRCRDAPDQNLR